MSSTVNKSKVATGLVLREATIQDANDIVKICSHSNTMHDVLIGQIQRDLELADKINPATSTRMIYVALNNDQIVGFISGRITNERSFGACVETVAVETNFQRTGIGSQLLSKLMSWFITRGEIWVKADLDRGRVALRYFYYYHKAEIMNEYSLFWRDVRKTFSE